MTIPWFVISTVGVEVEKKGRCFKRGAPLHMILYIHTTTDYIVAKALGFANEFTHLVASRACP